MKSLGMTTATDMLSIGLVDDQQIIAEKNLLDQRTHSVHLMPLLQELLQETQTELVAVDRFAVAIGPGSYTGLRIGVTTVKVLADVLHKELVGVSTLAALAQNFVGAAKGSLLVPLINARNDNFFASAFTTDGTHISRLIQDQHLSFDELMGQLKKIYTKQPVIFIGDELTTQKERLGQIDPSLVTTAQIATGDQALVHGSNVAILGETLAAVLPDELVPKYLRATQAEITWQKKQGNNGKAHPDSYYVEEV